MITAPTALVWSFSVILGTALASGLVELAALTAWSMAAAIWANRSLKPAAHAITLSLPVLLMLIVVQGFVGPLFPVDGLILSTIPVRSEGLRYGLDLGLTVVLVTFAATIWFGVRRDDLIDDLIWTGAPAVFVAIVGQTVAALSHLRRRISTVFLAQRARGAPVTGNLAARLRSIPAVFLPIIVGTVIEADTRALMLTSRGFGSQPLSCLTLRQVSWREIADIASLPLAIGVTFLGLRS